MQSVPTKFNKSGPSRPGKRPYELIDGLDRLDDTQPEKTTIMRATNVAREKLCLVCGNREGTSYHKIPQPKKFNKSLNSKALDRLDAHNTL